MPMVAVVPIEVVALRCVVLGVSCRGLLVAADGRRQNADPRPRASTPPAGAGRKTFHGHASLVDNEEYVNEKMRNVVYESTRWILSNGDRECLGCKGGVNRTELQHS